MPVAGFPGFGRFHWLHDPVSDRPYRGDFQIPGMTYKITRGEHVPDRKVAVTWAMGGKVPGPVIWTTAAYALILRRDVIDLLAREGIEGWSTYDVDVFAHDGTRHDEYAGMVIHGRVGPQELDRSTVELKQYPARCVPAFRGYFFDPQSWSGHDWCMASDCGVTIITSRVRECFEKARIGNLRLECLPDVLLDHSMVRAHKIPASFKEDARNAYRRWGLEPDPEFL